MTDARKRPKLTKRVVDATTCPPGRKDVLVFCGKLKGFGLRVTSGGAKVFLYQYRVGPRVKRQVIGDYGDDFTADQARTQAEILRGQVRQGGDPKGELQAKRKAEAEAERQARAAAEAEVLTFEKLVERWRDMKLKDRRPRYQTEASRTLLVSCAAWKVKPAHTLTPSDVVDQLDKIAKDRGPGAARSAYAYGRALYSWAVKRQLLASNPFAAIEPPDRVASRDRALSDDELGAVWRAAVRLGWPMGGLVRMALLTLQRRHEVAGMRWAELAPDHSTWTIPATRAKNAKAHVVHLAPAARTILKEAVKLKGSPYVFTTNGKRPVSGFSRTKAQLDASIAKERAEAKAETAELAGWRLHDFRRTGVTTLAALGFAPHVCDRLLNHVTGSIEGVAAVYQRHEFLAERKAALEAWAKHVLAVAEGKTRRRRGATPAQVVQLETERRRRRPD